MQVFSPAHYFSSDSQTHTNSDTSSYPGKQGAKYIFLWSHPGGNCIILMLIVYLSIQDIGRIISPYIAVVRQAVGW